MMGGGRGKGYQMLHEANESFIKEGFITEIGQGQSGWDLSWDFLVLIGHPLVTHTCTAEPFTRC